uniref:Transposase n=1 Tax=Panagrellus redivivus TaxID=6233 RepID=A0A7E4VT49_PANRE
MRVGVSFFSVVALDHITGTIAKRVFRRRQPARDINRRAMDRRCYQYLRDRHVLALAQLRLGRGAGTMSQIWPSFA